MRLIGIAAPAGHGKTTAARIIARGYGGWRVDSFAAPLKFAVAAAHGLPVETLLALPKEAPAACLGGYSPRELMQAQGDAWRGIDENYLISLARRRLKNHTVFDDVRTPGEADWIRRQGGLIIHLHRSTAPAVAEHSTEQRIPRMRADAVIDNHGSTEDLRRALCNAINPWLYPHWAARREAERPRAPATIRPGTALQQAMQAHNITADALAQACGVLRTAVSEWMRNGVSAAHTGTVAQLLAVPGASIARGRDGVSSAAVARRIDVSKIGSGFPGHLNLPGY